MKTISPDLRVNPKQERQLTGRDSLNRPMASIVKEPTPDDIMMRTRRLEPTRMEEYGSALQRKLGRL